VSQPFAHLTHTVTPVAAGDDDGQATRFDRLEAKLDAIGRQQSYITNHAAMLFAGLMNSPMGAMIRKSLPPEILETLNVNA
jgi:hypothetical protein